MKYPSYTVAFSSPPAYPDLPLPGGLLPESRWTSPFWGTAPVLNLDHFRPESRHRPATLCRLLYDIEGIYGLFKVNDRYVRAVHAGFQEPVYRDSCVEFFVQPETAKGYFNFEFNCGGAMLASYVTDPTRVDGKVKGFVPLSAEDGEQIIRFHSLPAVIEPEIEKPVAWLLEFRIPFAVLARYAGSAGAVSGRNWTANLYKCGDGTSHPHWASWSPLDALNFHCPENFGRITFEGREA